jgi:hypothetical protein
VKRLVLALFLFVSTLLVHSQSEFQEVSLPEYIIFNNQDLKISGKVISHNTFKYTIKSQGKTKKTLSFTLFPNELSAFKAAFLENIRDSILTFSQKQSSKYNRGAVNSEAEKVFYQFISAYSILDEFDIRPKAGDLCFNNSEVPVYKVSYAIKYINKRVRDSLRAFKAYAKDNCHDYKSKRKHKTKEKAGTDCVKGPKTHNGFDVNNSVQFMKSNCKRFYRADTSSSEWLRKKHFKRKYKKKLIEEDNKKTMDSIREVFPQLMRKKNDLGELEKIEKRLKNHQKELEQKRAWKSDQLKTLEQIAKNLREEFKNQSLKTSIILYKAIKDEMEEDLDFSQEKDLIEKEIDSFSERNSPARLDEGEVSPLNNLKETFNKVYDSLEVIYQVTGVLKDDIQNLKDELGILKSEFENDLDSIGKVRYEIDSLKSIFNEHKSKLNLAYFTPIEIEVEFNEGFIENIKVVGTTNLKGTRAENGMTKSIPLGDSLKFDNPFPFGFTAKGDYDKLYRVELFAKNNHKDTYVLEFYNLFKNYFQKHEVNRRDYSPTDGVFNFNDEKGFCRTLEKEETYKLLEAKVFSDFVGLSGAAPNGLLQTEISREFRLYTKRSIIGRRTYNKDAWNVTGLSYIEPKIVISKIENTNKSAFIRSFKNDSIGDQKAISTLDLRRHETLSINPGELNMFLLDIPGFKSTFYINFGAKFGRTSVRDTIPEVSETRRDTTYGINTVSYYPKVIWEIKTDERLGLFFSYQFEVFNKSLADNLTQVNNYNEFYTTGNHGNRLHVLDFTGFLNPNKSKRGRLFFRYRYTWANGSKLQGGFHQAQIGYSFFIIGKSKSSD